MRLAQLESPQETDARLRAAADAVLAWPTSLRVVDFHVLGDADDPSLLPWPVVGRIDLCARRGRRRKLSLAARIGDARLDALREVALGGHELTVADITQLHRAAQLEHLSISDTALIELVDALAAAPWQALKTLNLKNTELGRAGIDRLLGAGWLRNLRGLSWQEDDLGAAQWPTFARLRSLDLTGTSLTDASLKRLMARTGTELQTLTLDRNPIGPDLETNLPLLVRLSLQATSVGADSVTRLVRRATRLGRLYYDGAGSGGDAILAVLPGTVQKLALRNAGVTALGLRRFRAPDLLVLDLADNPLGDAGAASLGELQLPSLRWLCVRDAGFTPAGVSAFLGGSWMSRVEHLDLSGNDLTGVDVQRHRADGLRRLRLARTRWNNRELKRLLDAPALRHVTSLDLEDAELEAGFGVCLRDGPSPIVELTLPASTQDADVLAMLDNATLVRASVDLSAVTLRNSTWAGVASRQAHKWVDLFVKNRTARADEAARHAGIRLADASTEAGPWLADLEAAILAVLAAYGERTNAYIHKQISDSDTADDVFSQFCVSLVVGLPGFAFQCAVRTWVFTLTRNAVFRALDGDVRRKRLQEPLSQMSRVSALVHELSTTPSILTPPVRDALAEIRASLGDEDRLLLELYVDAELPWHEVASTMLGSADDPAAVKRESARLRKRFERLKARLRDDIVGRGLIER